MTSYPYHRNSSPAAEGQYEPREQVFWGRLTVSKLRVFSEHSHLLNLGTWTNIFPCFKYLEHFNFNLKCEFCNSSFIAFSPTFLECLDFIFIFLTLDLLALFRLAREARAWKLHRLHPEQVLEKEKQNISYLSLYISSEALASLLEFHHQPQLKFPF